MATLKFYHIVIIKPELDVLDIVCSSGIIGLNKWIKARHPEALEYKIVQIENI